MISEYPCRARKGVGPLITPRGRNSWLEGRAIPMGNHAIRRSPYQAKANGGPSVQRALDLNRPAAAVIPAPIAYIKVVAVKKLVVEP